MAPGFDQICMSRPRIIYLDLAPAPVSLFSTSARRVALKMDTRRGCLRDHRRKLACIRRQRENVELEWKIYGGKEDEEEDEEEDGSGGMCQRDTREH